MTIIASERDNRTGDATNRTLTYYVRSSDGTDIVTDSAAISAALAQAVVDHGGASTHEGMPIRNVGVSEIRDGHIDVAIEYGLSDSSPAPAPSEGTAQYEFETRLASQQVKQSLATISSYDDTSQKPVGASPGSIDFGGAINVDNELRVNGTNIQVPVSRFRYRYRLNNGSVTEAYRLLIESLVGHVNSTTFKGRAPGTVRFEGVSGGKRNNTSEELTFEFAFRANVSNLTIGNITGINADGWDYIWALPGKKADTTRGGFSYSPLYVYVERLYPRSDLNQLGIP